MTQLGTRIPPWKHPGILDLHSTDVFLTENLTDNNVFDVKSELLQPD